MVKPFIVTSSTCDSLTRDACFVGVLQRLPKAVPGSPAGIVCVELPASQGEGATLGAGEHVTLTVSAVYTKIQVP